MKHRQLVAILLPLTARGRGGRLHGSLESMHYRGVKGPEWTKQNCPQ